MKASTRTALRQLEQSRLVRGDMLDRTAQSSRLRWFVGMPARSYLWWQRAVSALVAVTLFAGPLSVTFEQSRDAAGILAAGNRRLDDEAWQRIMDLAAVRVHFAMQEAQATPIVDPNAPISFQPKITQSSGAGGGVPVVNITAPNSAGISLNQYQSFNIDPVGLILNNSLMSGTSLTGGNVQANPNLSGRTASVIVNQVTSTGTAYASLLNGPLEVFGAPATVIIVNPNGISTQGTGFTNTIGVTLSTGTPQFLTGVGGTATSFDSAQAIGYNVTGGHIQIEGNAGVNGPGSGIEGTVGTIDLIAETIGVNAPLYAGTRINAIAGDQFVSPSTVDATGTTYTTAANGSANTAAAINAANGNANSGLAIDATAYGAMTAGQIQVIGTAAGMGVRTDAQLAANAGDLSLSVNGDVTMAGSAAQQQASVTSSGNVTLTGTHIGVGGYALNANGDVSSTGTIQSGSTLSINAGGNINVASTQSNGDTTLVAGANATTGDTQSEGALSVTAQGKDGTGDITLNGTSVVTGATTLVAAQDTNINGQTSSGTLQATAQRDVNVNAAVQTSGDLALSATTGNLTTSANVNSAGNLALTSGQTTTIAGQATAQNAVTLTAGQGASVTGSLASGTTLTASTPGAFSVPGSLLVGTNATINGGSLDVPGVLIVQNNGTVTAQGDITGSGSMAFGQNGTLTSGQDVNVTGKLLANGLQVSAANSVTLNGMQAGGAFTVTANGASGNGDVTFNGNAAAVGATTVQAAGDVVVNGTLAGGAQVSLTGQGNVTVAAAGTVQSVGNALLTANTGSVNSTGTVNSAGTLVAQAAQNVSLTGATSVTGDTTLTAGSDVTTSGTVADQGNGTITAGQDVNLGGTNGFAKDVTVTAGNNVNVPGSLQGNNVTLNAGNSATLDNVQANSALAVTANGSGGTNGDGGAINVNGSVTSQTGSTLNAGGSVNVAATGTLGTSSTMNVTSAGNTTNAGTIVSNGNMNLANTAGSLTSSGTMESGTDLNINAAQSIDLGSNSTTALGNLTLTAGQNITMNGSVVSQGNGTLNAGGTIGGAGALAFGNAATLSSGGDTDLTGSLRGATIQTSAGGSGTFADVQAGSTVTLTASNDVNLTGTLAGGSTVTLTAGQDVNVSGTLQSSGDTSLTALNGSVGVTGAVNSNGALNVLAGTDINFGGTTTVALDTTLQGARDVNVTGSLNGLSNGFVTAGRNIGGAGSLAFAQSAVLNAAGAISQGGLIQGQNVQVTAAGDVAVNNVESASTLALTAGTGGSGSLTVNGAAAAASAITASAAGDVTVASAGKLAAGTTVGVTAANDINVAGAIESNGDAVLNAQQGSLNATGGINSGGVLTITTGLDLSLGASTSAVGDVTLNAGRNAILNGTLVGQGNGYINAGQDITGPGTQAFTNAAVLGAQGDIALTGSLQANSVQATGGDNAALNNVTSSTTLALAANGNAGNGDAAITGTATAPGVVTLNAARDVLVSGALGGGSTVTLAAQRNVTANGTVQAVGDLDVTATTGSVVFTGTTTTTGALNVTSGLDTQLGGQIAVTNNLTAQAGTDIELTGTVAGQATGSLTAGQDITGGGSAAFAQAATLSAANNVALTGALQGSSISVTGGNNAGLGSVQATTSNLNVTANGNAGQGDVTFGGAATAIGTTTLQAARDVNVTGAINSGGTTSITAARNATTADVNSAGDLTMTATSGNLIAGNVTTQGNLNESAGQALIASGQTEAAGNAMLVSGGNMTLTGGIAAQNTGTLTSGGTLTAGSVAFGQQATINAGGSINVSGSVATNGNLAATAGDSLSMGSVQAGGTVGLQAKGLDGTGDVSVQGVLTSGAATSVVAARDATVSGGVTSGDAVTVTAGRNLTLGGTVSANSDTALTATTGNLSVAGGITTVGNLTASAGGTLGLLGGALVNGDTTLTSTGTSTLTGDFYGLGAATVNAGGSVLGGGSLTFGKDIAITAGAGVTLGGIQGAGQLTATSGGDMSLGATTVVGNVTATSTGGSVAFNGALESGGNVQIQAANSATVSGAISSMGAVNVKGTNGNVSVAGVSSNGDTTMSAGQTLTLSGTSTVAGELALSGGNVTLSGTQEGSKNVTVSAQGTLDASQASLVSSQNMQLTGTNVTVGTAIVGGNLTAQASNQLSLVAGNVDVVGAASLVSQNGLTNASNVLSGGNLFVSAPSLVNTATGSLASTATTTIDATNFNNAGIVNGTTTNITVAGGLTNVGGALMGLNALTINTGSLNNQNGLIFAGNPDVDNGPTTGNLSLTINGGNGAFYNAGGQLLAQDNLGLSAVNMALDPSQGTISQGGQLSITAGSISVGGTWNYGGAGVVLDGINGITNSGTITGTTPLTMSTGGTFTNYGQVSGSDVTFNGTLYNAANAVLGASDALTINGNVTNRGTVQAGNALTVTGGTYDNQGAATQSQGNIAFNLSGTLLNTGGSIVAGNNININAASVVNDQAAPSGSTTTTTSITDPSYLWSINIGTETVTEGTRGGGGGDGAEMTLTFNATLGDLLAPTGSSTDLARTGGNCTNNPGFCDFPASQPVGGSGSVTFNEYSVQVGTDDNGGPVMQDLWFVGTAPDPHALASRTFALPDVEQTTTTQTPGASGVISAGGSISLTAGSLSNQGGQIAAQGNVSLNVQSLSNGSVASNIASPATLSVNEAQLSAFFAGLQSIGVVSVQGSYDGSQYVNYVPWTTFSLNAGLAQTLSGTTTTSMPTGMVAAGTNLTIDGGNLVNAGLLYAGNNVVIGAQSLQNQGGNSQNFSTQVGCASGVPDADCGTYNGHTGGGPTTTTFSYSQSDATIYAGNDLVIAAGQINNTYGNLLAGHDIVIGGVGTTATSTTPAQSLNNTSGNIVAGNDINLNVSGAITNNLPPPVPVYQNFGSVQQYSGCMTAGGYKESYCGAYVDQQSGSSSVISAGNNLQINAGSLTNIGSLISAGTSATINVAGPVVNEAQTLNAYWHSEWVQETGDFSSDIRHNTWACGSVAECTALYGTAYTSVGGTIDPPTPVGNIAATIEAPNLSISSGGQIQNVGNVIGTSVSLTGQSLINGITTANTYTPLVSAPSQVISLSPLNMPGLNISVPGSIGTGQLPTPVAGQASYLEQALGSQNSLIGPQQLLDALPASLQPGSTLFYYNPQEQALVLQQAALQQTGESSFVTTVPAASASGMSVTNQQTAVLYENAVTYAEQNNIQLGTALTQTQINALTAPMLWYVEQTVPDPDCQATNTSLCPTVTALMPQVYLPANSTALSAGGNIQGQNVTLDFNQGGDGSILNTGSITASGTLTVDTDTLTNQANQVNVGQIWQYIDNTGYEDTTGTAVQPGGFMSAANMNLNVQTLNQIGGALQALNSDGTVSAAGTQQLLAQLQQQLGGDFTQTAESNALNTSFTAEGGFGAMQVFALVAAVIASIVTYGAASAEIGATLGAGGGTFAAASATAATTAGLGNIALSAAIAGLASSVTSQVIGTGSVNWGSAFESAAVSAITAGLTNGITYNSTSGLGFSTGPLAVGGATTSLAGLAGVQTVGGSLVPQAGAAATSNLPGEALAIGADATIAAGVQTAIEGGSFLNALKNDAVSDVAAAGAYAIGNAAQNPNSILAQGSVGYDLAHAALGCAAGAAEGTGCASGAIGGATSAVLTPFVLAGIDPSATALSSGQTALVTAIAMLAGGGLAGALGENASGAATSAENEALNNDTATTSHIQSAVGSAQNAFTTVSNLWSSFTSQQAQQSITDSQVAVGVGQTLAGNLPAIAVGGALVAGGVLAGPEIVAACLANSVLCANEVAILAGEVAAGVNGMPAGTGGSVLNGVSSATNTAEGTANSVSGARLGMQLSAEEAAGAQAPTSISSYSNHALQQIAGRDGGIGVSQAAVDDAFANPTAIQYVPSTYGPTFKYIGQNATVVVNPQGNVVTTWGTSAAGVGK
jgi:filamentous hemagglutinin